MTSELVPGRNMALEITLLGIILSAVAYGVVITLFICCVNALLQESPLRNCPSAMTRFLLGYSSVLLVLSTWALAQSTFSIMSAIFGDSNGSFNWLHVTESSPWFLPITVWTADGFLVWRCLVLYEPFISRARRIALYIGLLLLCLMSLVAGFFTLVPLYIVHGPIIFIFVSGVINVTLSALIIVRLYSHKKSTQSSLGIYQGKLYTRIMVMLTESCVLIVVFTVLYIALYFSPKSHGSEIPLFLLPHICVISPLLIVYRVARRRASPMLSYSEDRLSITSNMGPCISFSTASSPIQEQAKTFDWNRDVAFSREGTWNHDEA